MEKIKAKIYTQGKITLGKNLMKKHKLKEGDEIIIIISDIINVTEILEKEIEKREKK